MKDSDALAIAISLQKIALILEYKVIDVLNGMEYTVFDTEQYNAIYEKLGIWIDQSGNGNHLTPTENELNRK